MCRAVSLEVIASERVVARRNSVVIVATFFSRSLPFARRAHPIDTAFDGCAATDPIRTIATHDRDTRS
jgi:hypothetical protein